MVDRFVRESQEVVKEPELDDQQEGTNQSRMLILGPVGMGKSHNMLVDVSFRRAAVDVNRAIYIPHCHAWKTDAFPHLIRAVVVAFPNDQEVFDRCVAAREYVRASSPHTADEKRECILALLTFAADYCFEHQLRLYLYADQLNAFQKDELDQFPFSILTSQVIRKWSARGAIVITAVSATTTLMMRSGILVWLRIPFELSSPVSLHPICQCFSTRCCLVSLSRLMTTFVISSQTTPDSSHSSART